MRSEFSLVQHSIQNPSATSKKLHPCLIAHQQTAYVQNSCISETGRLISDILEIADTLNLKGYLVQIDIEKALGSLNHSFLKAILNKFGFGPSFLDWIEAVLKNQESCVINNGRATVYLIKITKRSAPR